MSNKYNQFRKNTIISSIKQLKYDIYIKLGIYERIIKRIEKKIIDLNLSPDISSISENIAFVIDDEVVEIIHCQPKMAEILLGKPQIISIPKKTFPKIGWKYIDEEFKEKL